MRVPLELLIACLAAMDGAETVSAYARFNCTARYDAASDEYNILYGCNLCSISLQKNGLESFNIGCNFLKKLFLSFKRPATSSRSEVTLHD